MIPFFISLSFVFISFFHHLFLPSFISIFISLSFFISFFIFFCISLGPPLSLSYQSPVPQIGQAEDDSLLRERLEKQAVKPAVLIYTSGTTGNPKGVMLSHDNIIWTCKLAIKNFNIQKGMRILSYLPLSHVAGQMIDIHAPIVVQGTTFFADKNVMKGSLVDNLGWAKPTVFMGVPRVWEKIMEKMKEKAKDVKGLKKKISTKGKKVGLKCNTEDKETTLYRIFQKILFSKIKMALGLDQCDLFLSGAAPITAETMNYFMSLDIKINELYGMSESTGYHTGNTPDKMKLFTVGHLGCPSKRSKLDRVGKIPLSYLKLHKKIFYQSKKIFCNERKIFDTNICSGQ